jgi:photosystem II stability/assembly factor-like uncharacterized protein
MKNLYIAVLTVFFTFIEITQAQVNSKEDLFKNLNKHNSLFRLTSDYLERVGEWPYGSSLSVAVDSVRNIIFLGSGGAVLILDGTDKTNPQLITDTIRTTGLVEDIYYDINTERLYLACGEGGFEIWNVQAQALPQLMSRMEILYYNVETPVGHVQVKGNIAYLECNWGYVHSVNVSDPYNPYQVSYNGFMGNPAHDIHVGTDGNLHTTGQQEYVRFAIPPDGSLINTGNKHFTYGAGAVFGTPDLAYIGYDDYLVILDLTLPGFPAWSSTNVGGINHIEVREGYAYIANNDGLSIWNVSDYNSPFFVTSISTLSYAEDLFIAGDYVYVSGGAGGLYIVDISNPSTPILTGTFETYTIAVSSYVMDDIAFVAHLSDGLLMLDISNPDYPLLIGQYQAPGFTYDIDLQNNLAYLACWEGGFRIADVTDPSSPSEVSFADNFLAWKLEVSGNYAYVQQVNPPDTVGYIKIFNITDPANPVEESSTQIPYIAYGMVYYNGYLFLAEYDEGLSILNVTDPQNPFEATHLSLPRVFDVFIRDNYAYVCGGYSPQFYDGGFYVYDITNPEAPVQTGYYVSSNGFFDVSVAGSYAYVDDGDDVHLFYLESPNPVYISKYRLPDFISDIFAAGKNLYVSNNQAGFSIYTNNLIENPPAINWEFQTSGISQDIWAIYFTTLTDGWAAADDGILLHTTNGGDDWQTIQLGGAADNFRDLTFADESTGWVSGENSKMFRTTDGGYNWFQLNVPTTSVIRSMCFLNESLGWIVTLEDHLILKTTDGGQSWIQQNSGLTGNFSYHKVFFTDENNGFITGRILSSPQDISFILKTSDGGQSWSVNFNFQNETLDPIYFVNQDTGWIAGFYGFLVKTTDGGSSWQIQSSGPDEVISDLYFFDENKGWYTGNNGALYQTNDGGVSWLKNVILIEDDLRTLYFVNEGNGWAAGSNGIILHYNDTTYVPVDLKSFSANVTAQNVLLTWSTATETNNRGFEVERLQDCKIARLQNSPAGKTGWERIGFVEGNGTTTLTHSYSYTDKNVSPGKYYYRLKQIDFNGSYKYSNEIEVDLTAPARFSLEQNYPNPFNPATTIKYAVPKTVNVGLKVFDILGREIKTLVNETKNPGYYEIQFNANSLAGGVYFYRLKAGGYIKTGKMLLLK